MNILVKVVIFAALSSAYAQDQESDIEILCRMDTDAVKNLYTLPVEELEKGINKIEKISSLNEFSSITGASYSELVNTIKKYRKVNVEEAELIVLKMLKDTELNRIRSAIKLKQHDVPNEFWHEQYASCIEESKRELGGG